MFEAADKEGPLALAVFNASGRTRGPIADLVTSRDGGELYIFAADGSNSEVNILLREDGRKLGSFGRPGRMAGEFRSLHNMAIDSHGNIYTAEAGYGRRVQKFRLQ